MLHTAVYRRSEDYRSYMLSVINNLSFYNFSLILRIKWFVNPGHVLCFSNAPSWKWDGYMLRICKQILILMSFQRLFLTCPCCLGKFVFSISLDLYKSKSTMYALLQRPGRRCHGILSCTAGVILAGEKNTIH